MKRFYALALAMALGLASCGQGTAPADAPAAPTAPDPMNLSIEVGRYGVMLSQVHGLTGDRPGAAEMDATDPRDIARRLRETVWEYNLERSSLCARGLFAELACAPAYQPVWIGEPAAAVPTLEELQVRSDALGAEVQRFWDAVCEEARAAEVDAQQRMFVCAIE